MARTGPLDAAVLLRGLQSTLPMGDVNATDYGQVGHLNVLRAGGAARLEQLVAYRQPAPRGSTWELVMVDDHVVVQVVPRGGKRLLSTAPSSYAASEDAAPPGRWGRDQVLAGKRNLQIPYSSRDLVFCKARLNIHD